VYVCVCVYECWCALSRPGRCWIDVGQDALAKSKKLVEEKDKTIEEVSGWVEESSTGAE